MKYAIITGTSKGLGASRAEKMIKAGVNVVGISRNENPVLEELASQSKVRYHHFRCNLTNVENLDRTFAKINDLVVKEDPELVYLINNAATVKPIDIASNQTIEAVQAHMQLNLIAPIITTSLLLKKARRKGIKTIIANVTSGAANRSTYGWSAYGSSKAGLNRFTETVALEQRELGTDNKVILLDPSIMDTNMQSDIRSTDEESFRDVNQFKQYKEENKLSDTADVANVFVTILLEDEQVVNGKYYSIKDYR